MNKEIEKVKKPNFAELGKYLHNEFNGGRFNLGFGTNEQTGESKYTILTTVQYRELEQKERQYYNMAQELKITLKQLMQFFKENQND